CLHYLTSDEACANVPRSYAGQRNPQPKLVTKLNPKGTTDEEVTEVRHRPIVRGGVCRRRACRYYGGGGGSDDRPVWRLRRADESRRRSMGRGHQQGRRRAGSEGGARSQGRRL